MGLFDPLKRIQDGVRALRLAQGLKQHERWTVERLRQFQEERLQALVHYAAAKSPFYAELYRGIDLAGPGLLQRLPTVSRAQMMAQFDRFVTDPRLKLAALQEHAAALRGDEYYLGEYRVLLSSGSTGEPGLFVFDRKEWSVVQASRLRAAAFLHGAAPALLSSSRSAYVVSSRFSHVSRRVGASLPGAETLYLDAAAPIPEQVSALNSWQPDSLTGYSSLIFELALEQTAGRLRIQPRQVAAGAEMVSPQTRAAAEQAWQVGLVQTYGLTECSGCGISRPGQSDIHLFEDLCILEPAQDKVLLTNLYNLTQPLIRYEVSDLLSLDGSPCPCGCPFRRISRISGRREGQCKRGLRGI